MARLSDMTVTVRAKINRDDWDRITAQLAELEQRTDAVKAQADAPSGIAAVVAGGLVLAGSASREVSRRSLLSFGFLRGKAAQ